METQDSLNLFHPLDESERKILDTLTKNLSEEKKMWLSGYFWGKSKFSKNKSSYLNLDLNNTEREKAYRITILCASQTGNARIASKVVKEVFDSYQLPSILINVCDYKIKNISKEKILILIISTHGEGEPPEEAIFLHKFLFSKKSIQMKSVNYSVFGLGDSSYDHFCKAGKDFDNRILKLGGKKLLDRVDADIEYKQLIKEWSEKLSVIIKKNFFSQFKNNKEKQNYQKYNNKKNIKIFNKENPFLATILSNKRITGRNSNKIVNHIEIDLQDSKITYKPGDVLGIWYKNDAESIKNLLKKLKIHSIEKVLFKSKKETIFNLLRKKFEITVNTKKIVESYNYFAKSNLLQNIISDSLKIRKYVQNISLLEMIYQNPTKITADQLISFLRPLTPRLYSISSSQKETDDEVHITVGLLKYQIENRIYTGGASNYLINELKEEQKVSIFIQENKNFRLPNNKDSSIIMISAGTGIAPFRAFMQERENTKSKGKNWLFFGNQYFTEDFLYQTEWQQYFKNKLLTKVSLAWSRDQKEKIYVQHKILENGLLIWKWIESGAYIYVCGDALNMAKEVEEALLLVFEKYGNMNKKSSEKFLFNLRKKSRYQRDVY
ncbi:assimilatory sulfite reductase (NADPH) flavoprotein subunit [Buchnera aphidicola]|uniref:assimilatory sulfite reductase (NADPH) flavoprotein subunit n=1 Tax=Buchnera aphidicola TaxID=9 RepID=UPI0034639DFC